MRDEKRREYRFLALFLHRQLYPSDVNALKVHQTMRRIERVVSLDWSIQWEEGDDVQEWNGSELDTLVVDDHSFHACNLRLD